MSLIGLTSQPLLVVVAQAKVSFGWVITITLVLAAVLAFIQGDSGGSSVTDETGGAFGGFIFWWIIFMVIGTIIYLAIWQ